MKVILFILSLLVTTTAIAQFNDSTHYHVNLNATGSINRTDASSVYLLNNTLVFGVKINKLSLTATNIWVYGAQNDALTNNDFSSTVYANLNTGIKQFYYWALVNYNTSYSLKINNQLLAGVGLAYDVINTPNFRFNLSDGVLYDNSSLLTTLNYHTYRNSFRVQVHYNTKELITFDSVNFLQNSFDDGKDYILKSNTTLGLKLRKWISLTTTLAYNKMNITDTQNLTFTYGIALDKYF